MQGACQSEFREKSASATPQHVAFGQRVAKSRRAIATSARTLVLVLTKKTPVANGPFGQPRRWP